MKTFWGIAGAILVLGLPVLLLFLFMQDRGDADGHIELKTDREPDGEFTRLMLDGIDYGRNYAKPDNKADWGRPDKDKSRLATTYYHQGSPVGLVMQQYDWFKEWKTRNRYLSDARMPAALLSQVAAPLGILVLPLPALVGLWSEPPIGVIGLGCGTMTSYARPYQHMHIFERSAALAKLSFPPPGEEPRFHFVQDALRRGALVQVHAGDERDTLAEKKLDGFFHVLVVESARAHPDRPVVKRLTREAMSLYVQKLAPGGIICYHISSRNYDLGLLLGDVAKDLGLVGLVGRYRQNPPVAGPFYSSEWFLVARRDKDLARVKARGGPDLTWSPPELTGRLVMTDATPKMIRDARRR